MDLILHTIRNPRKPYRRVGPFKVRKSKACPLIYTPLFLLIFKISRKKICFSPGPSNILAIYSRVPQFKSSAGFNYVLYFIMLRLNVKSFNKNPSFLNIPRIAVAQSTQSSELHVGFHLTASCHSCC